MSRLGIIAGGPLHGNEQDMPAADTRFTMGSQGPPGSCLQSLLVSLLRVLALASFTNIHSLQ